MDNYFDRTDAYLRTHGGQGPKCPVHGTEMFAADDHGRFACFSCGLGSALDVTTGLTKRSPPILQVPESVELTDEQKAQIPAINRLGHKGTPAEQRMLGQMLRGEDYTEAMGKVDAERRQAGS